MAIEELLVGLLVIVVVAVVVYALRSPKSPSRNLWRDDRGDVVAIGERQRGAAGRFSGRGSQLTKAVELGVGEYRLDYQFEATTRVALVDASGDETLLIKRGAGSEALSISAGGAYRFLVEPANETAAWALEYCSMRQMPASSA